MSARTWAVAGGVLAASGVLLACSAVLGFETFTLDAGSSNNGEGGPSGSDGTTTDCGDTVSSGENCGICGHGCLGGTCMNSKCQPVMVASGLQSPEGITVTNDSIFVAEYGDGGAGRIKQYARVVTPTGGGEPVHVFLDVDAGADNITGMGNDGTNLYWAVQQIENVQPPSINYCPLTGCSQGSVLAALDDFAFDNVYESETLLPLQLVVQGKQVFWGENNTGRIQSVSTDGMKAVTTYLGANSSYAPVDIAVDGANVYFSTNGRSGAASQIFGVALDSEASTGTAFMVAQGAARSAGIATANGQLYWTTTFQSDPDLKDGLVTSALTTQRGGGGVVVALSQQNARMVLTDGTNVYWIASGDSDEPTGKILYCPVAGCPDSNPIVLAQDQNAPLHLAQDAQGIYWTNEGVTANKIDGQVWKIAKPR